MQKQLIRSIFSACLIGCLLFPVLALAQWHKEYEAAIELVRKGRYSEAIPKLQAAVKEKEREASVIELDGAQMIDYFPFYYLGKSFFYSQNYPAAVQHFEKSLAQGEIQKKKDLFRNLTDLKAMATAQVNLEAQKQSATPVNTAESQQAQPQQDASAPPSSEQPGQNKSSSVTPNDTPGVATDQPAVDQTKEQARGLARDGARLYFTGEIDAAMTMISQALALDPNNATAQFLFGCCFATKYLLSGSKDQRQLENASSAFQKAKQLSLPAHVAGSPFISPAVMEIFTKS